MPKTMVNVDVIQTAIQLACRAPSLHNTQPWRWIVEAGDLHLHLDRTRCVKRTDGAGREAIISCGAALDHLRVAMASAGWMARVERIPDAANPDHLATVTFSPRAVVVAGDRRRADAILQRRTDRLPFGSSPHWSQFARMLNAVIADRAVILDVVDDAIRPKLAEASALSDALRIYDSAYQTELDWWTAPFTLVDGIPRSALVSAAESDRVDIGRTFPVVTERPPRSGLQEDKANVLALSTARDTPKNLLRCGELLSEVLLEATLAGMATCTITHMLELTASREVVGAAIGRTHPQALIRVGLAPTFGRIPPPTPRRQLADVFEIRG
ncbi:NAD(P)H nitroreductase [Mycobacterium sp. NPDC050853]|uniref:Acg family FMN-binding oxidoreductase n=1 Tax=Mycobacterium sp. NPDC050853 TaxID=3155160 RepID=UPI00340BDEF1